MCDSALLLSESLGFSYSNTTDDDHKSKYGQFFTPKEVAMFMASFAGKTLCSKEHIHILDPGAGTGILTVSLCHYLVQQAPPTTLKKITCTLYEQDADIIMQLEQTMQQLHASFNATNMTLEYNIVNDDFVIRAASSDRTGKFDVVICNPPYFKVNAKSIHATATKNIVQGQCNMYTLFMSLSALLLKEDGLLLFLVPRSFTSGKYFEKFRKEFFGHMSLDAVHLFQSRSDAFKKDNVLQENIILLCRKNQHQSAEIQLSVCEGASDIGSRIIRRVASDIVLCSANIVRLPCTEQEDQTLQQVDEWECSLSKLGFAVSTGPIVAFRAQSHIIENKEKGKYPLLWMHHVKPMAIEWPIVSLKKPQYLTATAPENLLVSCKNMVLLRRFSAKEQERRVIACPLIASDLSSSLEKLGIENHLNYITGVDTEMTDEQTFGLAALLSSDIVDRYVRISSGNTQISATELGLLPLPDMNILERIGRKLIDVSDRSLSVVNQIIVETLATKKKRLVAIEHADGPQRKKTK